jgi:hypothetical protein
MNTTKTPHIFRVQVFNLFNEQVEHLETGS